MHRLLLLTATAVLAFAPGPAEAQSEPVVIYLVRHAERADDGPARDMWAGDPPLSAAGEARAQLLARMLRDAGLTHAHSTRFVRTWTTAAPLADQSGLILREYDPADLSSFAARLLRTPGRHLVAGHSNTTPALVEALGGMSHGPIAELEYDRLYVLTIAGGETSTVLLRFGEPFRG